MWTRPCVFHRSIPQSLPISQKTSGILRIIPSLVALAVVLLCISSRASGQSRPEARSTENENRKTDARVELRSEALDEILILNQLVMSRPDDLELKRRFVSALIKGEYFITAVEQMTEILDRTPGDDDLRRQLIEIARKAGDRDMVEKQSALLSGALPAGTGPPKSDPPVKVAIQELEMMVADVILNSEKKGELFVKRSADGDFFVKAADMKELGFRELTGSPVEMEGEPYFSLRSIRGIKFVFNENTLSLEITAEPYLLPTKTVNFMPQRQPNVYYPKDRSVFLNYRLDYNAGNSFRFQSFDIVSQVGVRTGDILFLSDGIYTKTPESSQFVRLMSNITYDDRKDLRRLVAGDFVASSGDLGSALTLGGVSFSKAYSIDPYFIRYPLANFSGFASLPSTAEVYLNGILMRTERLSPGEFELRNMSYYGGAGSVMVVLKDAFGRERIERFPFYFTNILLREGLHEYSYNAGFIRSDLNEKSNSYSGLTFLGFHRYGVSDYLTVGIGAEGGKGNYNLGPQAAVRIENAGVLSASLSGSVDSAGRSGFAGLLNYGYQGQKLNAQLFLKGFTRDYAMIGNTLSPDRTQYELGVGAGYSTKEFGSASVLFNKVKKFVGQDIQSLGFNYSRNILQNVSVFASFRRVKLTSWSNDFFFGIIYFPWERTTVSANYEKSGGVSSETLQVQKNLPIGEGYGYNVRVSRADAGSSAITTINPSFSYNSPYGTYAAEYLSNFTGGRRIDNYLLSAAGGIAYVGNTFGFSRPINDSFGLVNLGVEGVRVYENNQEIGRTDSSGRVFVPNLSSYYDNQISINDKDVPINYYLKDIVKYVSPPLRSGSVINFEATKIQGITGKLKIRADGIIIPLESYEARVTVEGKEITFPTGKGGEFYFENVKAGKYSANVDYKEKKCVFDIIIPDSEDVIIDLGDVICEDMR